MNTLVAQLPALLGVLVGTLGTILATSLADRGRWRRSQQVRWDERRIDAYAEFAQVVKEIHTISTRVVVRERQLPGRTGVDREAGLARLADADVRHTIAWETVLLLGDAPTVAAAQLWRDAVRRIMDVAGGTAVGDETLPELLRRADEGRDAFYRAAREGLGVRGGSVAQSDLLRQRRDVFAASPSDGADRSQRRQGAVTAEES